MDRQIGDAAGRIWRYLDQHGAVTLTRLKQGTKLSQQTLLMGIGWLAREEKLRFDGESRTLRVGLKDR